jgi:hypothetical protein
MEEDNDDDDYPSFFLYLFLSTFRLSQITSVLSFSHWNLSSGLNHSRLPNPVGCAAVQAVLTYSQYRSVPAVLISFLYQTLGSM